MLHWLPALLFFTSTVVCAVEGISVPTGKKTPITPARPTERPLVPRYPRAPAPVVEYTQENPEPPPLDPSYVPVTYKYLNALVPNAIQYVPLQLRIPNYGLPEINPYASKPHYQKVINYAVPKRQYFYQEETKPEYHFIKKFNPLKQGPPKDVYNKDFVYRREQESRPNKGSYPKKATIYPDNSKYYYQFQQD